MLGESEGEGGWWRMRLVKSASKILMRRSMMTEHDPLRQIV